MDLSRRPRSGENSGSGAGSGKCWEFLQSVSRLVWCMRGFLSSMKSGTVFFEPRYPQSWTHFKCLIDTY